MNFDLSEEQTLLRQTIREFAEREIAPGASARDEAARFPSDLIPRMADLGLFGINIPQEYGGAGMDFVSYIIALEEISKVWASLGTIMSVNNSLVCGPLLRYGSEAQIKRYLPLVAGGEWTGCYALTEPTSGSDAGSIQTQAKRVSDGYLLNGAKVFTTNGSCAELAIVYAVTDPNRGKQGISAFLVERRSPGFIVGRIEDKLGLPLFLTVPLIHENGNGLGWLRNFPLLNHRNGHGTRRKALSKPDSVLSSDESNASDSHNSGLQKYDSQLPLRPFFEALRDRLISFFEIKNLTHKPKLVAVTSCREGSGVSTFASGLASA